MAKLKKEDIRPVTLTFEDGETYTLEFSKNTIIKAEELGYREDELSKKSMTMGTLLFHCAFLMHHPTITKQETDKILLEDIGGFTEDLATRLIALYDLQASEILNTGKTPKNPRLKVSL